MLEGAAGGVQDGERSESRRVGGSEGEVDVLQALKEIEDGDEAEDQVERNSAQRRCSSPLVRARVHGFRQLVAVRSHMYSLDAASGGCAELSRRRIGYPSGAWPISRPELALTMPSVHLHTGEARRRNSTEKFDGEARVARVASQDGIMARRTWR